MILVCLYVVRKSVLQDLLMGTPAYVVLSLCADSCALFVNLVVT